MIVVNKIVFGGFKNIEKFSIDFSAGDIMALASQNNYGKSNVLAALTFITEYITAPNELKHQMMSDSNLIPMNIKIQNNDFFAKILFDYEEDEINYNAMYEFSFSWLKNKKNGCYISFEKLYQKTNDKKQKYQTLINRTSDGCFYKASETGRCSTKIKVDDNGLAINRLAVLDSLFYCKLIEEINKLRFYNESHLDARFAFKVSPLTRKGIRTFDFVSDDQQLPKVLYNLKKEDNKSYKRLVSKCKTLFPEIDEFIVDNVPINFKSSIPKDAPFIIDNSIYILFFKNKFLNQPLDFEQISDGVKRIVLLLTNMTLADKNNLSVMAIEEPENSIHPKLLESYINIIRDYSKQFRIIVTSHSPYLVKCLNINNVLVGLPNNDGLACFGELFNHRAFTALCSKREETNGECVFNLLNENEDKLSEFWKWNSIEE